jgi:hypothetical protein
MSGYTVEDEVCSRTIREVTEVGLQPRAYNCIVFNAFQAFAGCPTNSFWLTNPSYRASCLQALATNEPSSPVVLVGALRQEDGALQTVLCRSLRPSTVNTPVTDAIARSPLAHWHWHGALLLLLQDL